MKYSITKNGVPLDKSLYTLDEKTKTFSSDEDGLVLDFSNETGWTFKTGYDCTFKTNSRCTFSTGSYCTFSTGYDCTLETGSHCVIVRRDIYEVIELKEGVKIKLNGYGIKGFTEVTEVTEIKDTPIETIEIGGIKYSKQEVEEKLKGLKAIIS